MPRSAFLDTILVNHSHSTSESDMSSIEQLYPAPSPRGQTRGLTSHALATSGLSTKRLPESTSIKDSLTSADLYMPAPGDTSVRARLQRLGFRLLKCPVFDTIIGFVILANSLCIGIDQSYRLENVHTPVLDILENVFLAVYTFEIVLRFFVMGKRCLEDNWVKFDCLLVITGYLSLLVMATLDLKEFEVVMVLRTIRMLRLARTVRLLVKFRVLWMLVRGLLNSAGTMVYTMLLLLIMIYVFSSIGIELITYHPMVTGDSPDPEFHNLVREYFRSIPVTMLTLLQFVCLDSVGSIYKPLIEKDLEHGNGLVLIYFVGVILIMPIVLMNIVTAVVVNGAVEQAAQDKDAQKVQEEMHKKKVIKKLEQIFRYLDQDNSEEVSLEEIKQIRASDRNELLHLTKLNNIEEIFNALDIDRNGHLSIEEFCEGIWQANISQVPPEMQRMEKQVNRVHKELRRAGTFYNSMQGVLEQIAQELTDIRRALHREVPRSSNGSMSDGEERHDGKDARAAQARGSSDDMPLWARVILFELQGMRNIGDCPAPSAEEPPEPHALRQREKPGGAVADSNTSQEPVPSLLRARSEFSALKSPVSLHKEALPRLLVHRSSSVHASALSQRCKDEGTSASSTAAPAKRGGLSPTGRGSGASDGTYKACVESAPRTFPVEAMGHPQRSSSMLSGSLMSETASLGSASAPGNSPAAEFLLSPRGPPVSAHPCLMAASPKSAQSSL